MIGMMCLKDLGDLVARGRTKYELRFRKGSSRDSRLGMKPKDS